MRQTMQSTNVAVILAAGNGSRIKNVSGALPKPLVEVNGRPLLEHVIRDSQAAGIERFVIVLGYRAEAIEQWLWNRSFRGAQIEVVKTDHSKANGISTLQARNLVKDRFLLLMSDHLFDPQTAADLLQQPVESESTILAVDRKLQAVFDMDDATKVCTIGSYITDIGKQLSRFDAVDTGMFVCSQSLFTALDASIVNGNCSLSDGMRVLSAKRKLRAFDIGDALWQDVDTPEALEHASVVFSDRSVRSTFDGQYANV